MQQYVVPQFIDVEGKIIGPITTRQFVMILVGGLGTFLAFRFTSFSIFVVLTGIIVLLVIIFGFIKVNSRPFHLFLINLVQTIFVRPMLRVWRREEISGIASFRKAKEAEVVPETLSQAVEKLATRTKLAELSLIVDTGGAYKAEEDTLYGPP